jgi:hypothetical protein
VATPARPPEALHTPRPSTNKRLRCSTSPDGTEAQAHSAAVLFLPPRVGVGLCDAGLPLKPARSTRVPCAHLVVAVSPNGTSAPKLARVGASLCLRGAEAKAGTMQPFLTPWHRGLASIHAHATAGTCGADCDSGCDPHGCVGSGPSQQRARLLRLPAGFLRRHGGLR